MISATFVRTRFSPVARRLAFPPPTHHGFAQQHCTWNLCCTPPSSPSTCTAITRCLRFFSKSSKDSIASSTKNHSKNAEQTFLQRFLGPKDIPPRGTIGWYGEMLLICTVFAITGTSTMMLVRPAVKNVLGLEGSFKDGPWSYRISTLVIMSPLYSILLVIVGTVFGRHAYFRFFSVKMLSRFGIPPELLDKEFHVTKKNFRKW